MKEAADRSGKRRADKTDEEPNETGQPGNGEKDLLLRPLPAVIARQIQDCQAGPKRRQHDQQCDRQIHDRQAGIQQPFLPARQPLGREQRERGARKNKTDERRNHQEPLGLGQKPNGPARDEQQKRQIRQPITLRPPCQASARLQNRLPESRQQLGRPWHTWPGFPLRQPLRGRAQFSQHVIERRGVNRSGMAHQSGVDVIADVPFDVSRIDRWRARQHAVQFVEITVQSALGSRRQLDHVFSLCKARTP